MTRESRPFLKPTPIEAGLNKLFGSLVRIGLASKHSFLLEVRGRKTGRIYSTPVNVVDLDRRQYLVAPRGYTQWVRNARAVGRVTLKRGFIRRSFNVRTVSDDRKPEILKAYLDQFKRAVQRYFPIPVGSESSEFIRIADRYPVFELVPPASQEPRIEKQP